VWLALAVGALGLAIAGLLLRAQQPERVGALRITAGPDETSRALVARGLAQRLTWMGVPAETVAIGGDELAKVESREVDLALISSVLRTRDHPHVREVAPLQIEALHLLVKDEIAGDVGHTLAGLRGRRVDVGPKDSAGAALARTVLVFAGLEAGDGKGPLLEQLEIEDLEQRMAEERREDLPDAVFHLATVPSRIALRLIRAHRYRLVALPFADAFRLRTLLAQAERGAVSEGKLDLADVGTTDIPAFTYRTEPPEPAEPLPTLGATLLLLAHEDVPAHAVEDLLAIVYNSQFARIAHPPLLRSTLAARPALRRHPGTAAFLARDEPFLSARDVDKLNNTLGVAGALLGGFLFLWQGLRQMRAARRDRVFAGHMLRVAGIEQRLVAHELASELDLEKLITLQRELLELKQETLDHFARGEIGDHRALAELLAPVDVARDHVAALLLHVRERVADRADAEGKSVAAVWTEEVQGEPDGPPRAE
jgi:TRAP-type uncharacterized transport system substrate-binding protein